MDLGELLEVARSEWGDDLPTDGIEAEVTGIASEIVSQPVGLRRDGERCKVDGFVVLIDLIAVDKIVHRALRSGNHA